jgi:hypothetical protein
MNGTDRLPAMPGRCLCGDVTFTAEPARAMHVCHCDFCRRSSGGAWIGVDCGDTIEISGDVRFYASSDWAERGFCGRCGSTLFWRLKAGGVTIASIQAFDDPSPFTLESELFVDAKPGNYAFAGDHPTLTAAETMAMFADQG